MSEQLSATQVMSSESASTVSRPTDSGSGGGLRWADSVGLGLAISLIVGLLYALLLMGPGAAESP